jgi:probable rRNA maturation factor
MTPPSTPPVLLSAREVFLELEGVLEDAAWPVEVVTECFLAPIAAAIAGRIAFDVHEKAVIAFADDAAVRALNARYRNRDRPTNVLSFPAAAAAPAPADLPKGTARLLGDIILARETVAREAGEQGIEFLDHTTHLIVHGVLHLAGYDHETERDALEMEGLEVEILAMLDIDNPHTEELLGSG